MSTNSSRLSRPFLRALVASLLIFQSIGIAISSAPNAIATTARDMAIATAMRNARQSGNKRILPSVVSKRVIGPATQASLSHGPSASAKAIGALPVVQAFNKGMITLSFDDGWETQYKRAKPILDAANITATFYPISRKLNIGGSVGERINNGSLEQNAGNGNPVGWNRGGWGDDFLNGTIFTYPVSGGGGGYGARVQATRNAEGAAEWWFDEIPVTPGERIEFYHAYNSTTDTETGALFKLSNGKYDYRYLNWFESTGGWWWQGVTEKFTVPEGAVSMTVIHLLAQPGMLEIDACSIKGAVASSDPDRMTDAHLLDLQKRYEVSSHTQTHPSLISLTPDQLQSEIAGSLADLVSLKLKPATLAYPFGDYNLNVQMKAKAVGYIGARTVDPGYNDMATNPFGLKAMSVEWDTDGPKAQVWIDRAREDRTWVILVLHQVDLVPNPGARWGTNVIALQDMVSRIKASGLDVVTVQQGLAKMGYK